MKFSEILNDFGKFTNKNAPTILSVIAGIGVITTSILSAKGTLVAKEIVQKDKEMTKGKAFCKAAPCYIPALVSGGLTIAAIAMSNRINSKRILALSGALAMTNDQFKKYTDKVKVMLGEKTSTKVSDEISKDAVSKIDTTGLQIPGSGKMLCMDSITGQLFMGDINQIDAAMNRVNKDIMISGWYSLNSLLYEISDGQITSSSMGDLLGWNTGDMIEIQYSSCLTKNNIPCLVIKYTQLPVQVSWD